jgi:hypothetical protein
VRSGGRVLSLLTVDLETFGEKGGGGEDTQRRGEESERGRIVDGQLLRSDVSREHGWVGDVGSLIRWRRQSRWGEMTRRSGVCSNKRCRITCCKVSLLAHLWCHSEGARS